MYLSINLVDAHYAVTLIIPYNLHSHFKLSLPSLERAYHSIDTSSNGIKRLIHAIYKSFQYL